MEIRPEPIDIIQGKLEKIRCCTGCLKGINYLVYGHGLYCTECLSTLPEIKDDHFIMVGKLAQILVDLTNQYGQRSRGEVSQVNLMKGEMQAIKKDVKKSKQSLTYDARTVKEKSIASIDELFAECLKQNQNQPLEAFYEPDITATLILNESQLLLQNLENLKVSEKDGKMEYNLVERNKNPERINKKIDKEYSKLNDMLDEAEKDCKAIIADFLNEIKEA